MISIEIKGKIQNGAGGTIGSGGQKLFKSNQIQLNRTKIKWWNIEKESENVVKVKLMNKNKEEREREMMMMMTLVRESESERVRERQRDRETEIRDTSAPLISYLRHVVNAAWSITRALNLVKVKLNGRYLQGLHHWLCWSRP